MGFNSAFKGLRRALRWVFPVVFVQYKQYNVLSSQNTTVNTVVFWLLNTLYCLDWEGACPLWAISMTFLFKKDNRIVRHHHHNHHHVHEWLGVFPVPGSSKCNWSLHLFLGRPMFLSPFGLYCNACFRILFVSILCTCCSHFSWYCFISFTIFSARVFSLIHWFF